MAKPKTKEPSKGYKTDKAKDRWDLLPTLAVREIVRVLTLNCKSHGGKYPPHNWKTVPGARRRYYAAMKRHIEAWWEGEKYDPDLKKSHGVLVHHLGCAGCCLLFLLYLDMKGKLEELDALDEEAA